ncbi:MAG: DUF4422 domain-containing protein [Catonella sp.]|nr:DUF4422 domain-containing protein [Catonella sp.]
MNATQERQGQNTTSAKPDIKLFVVCHKPCYVPDLPFLHPIQVNAAANGHMDFEYHDDDGEDNISSKNRSFCELTAQYWVWKHVEADYYGFFHYRRYFSFFPEKLKDVDEWGNLNFDHFDEFYNNETGLNEEQVRKAVEGKDIIVVGSRKLSKDGKTTVGNEYGKASFQHEEDFKTTIRVLLQKYPEYKNAVDQYLNSTTAHECNMFIMKRDLFKEYGKWLFDILFEVEKLTDVTFYNQEELRIFGYLAERLCGIFFTQQELLGKNCGELPKTYIWNTEPREEYVKPVFEDGIPIILSANGKFSPYLDVAIRSMVENSSPDRRYDFIVLFNDISAEDQKTIRSAAKGRDNISIRFIKVSQYFDQSKFYLDQHLSIETYYRLVIPDIMPDYKKVIYIDCDLVVERDLAELYDTDLHDHAIGATHDLDVAGQVKLGMNEWPLYMHHILKIDNPYSYFQAGVLILNLEKIRQTTTVKDMMACAQKVNWKCHDQDVLNHMFNGDIEYLPLKWNVYMDWRENDGRSRGKIMKEAPFTMYNEYQQARKNPYVIHYAGYQKPWDVVDCDFANNFWKYAAKSPYYTRLLFSIKRSLVNDFYREKEKRERSQGQGSAEQPQSQENLSVKKKLINAVFPYNTKRRAVAKSIKSKLKHESFR